MTQLVSQIPNLIPAISITGAEQLEAVQAGSTVRITTAQIATLITHSADMTVGVSSVFSGVTSRVLYDNAGVLGEYLITGTGSVVMSDAPTLTGLVSIPLGTIADINSMWLSDGMPGLLSVPRLFVGAAAGANDGDYNGGAGADWVSALFTPSTSISQFACYSTIGGTGAFFATRTSDSNVPDHQPADQFVSVGLQALIQNDNTGTKTGAAAYFEGRRVGGGAGLTRAVEIDAVNLSGGTNNVDPFSSQAASTKSDWGASIAAGGSRAGALNSSVGLGFNANGAALLNGIMFSSDAVADSGNGQSRALVLPLNYAVQWYGAASTPTGFLSSGQTNTIHGIEINDFGVYLAHTPFVFAGSLIVQADIGGGPMVNSVGIAPGPTGVAPTISSTGSDTNIDLRLQPQGSGSVVIPAPLTATKFNGLTVTSSTGTLTVAAAKTLTVSHSMTLTGTDGVSLSLAGNLSTSGAFNTTLVQAATTIITLPATNSTMARTDAAQTFTGNQTFSGNLLLASGTLAIWNSDVTFSRNSSGVLQIGTGTTANAAGTLLCTGVTAAGAVNVAAAVATPAAGSTSARLLFGTTAGFGIYYGSSAPTVSAAKGSLYLRSDGTTTNDRAYIATDSSGAWTALTTAA